jgi:hypothetical protein
VGGGFGGLRDMKMSPTALFLALIVPYSGVVMGAEEVPPPFEEGKGSGNNAADYDPELDGDPEFDPFDPESFEPDLPKMIQVQVEYIEVSLEALSDLMFLRDPKGDATGLRKEVQELIQKGEGTVKETMIVASRPGQKSSTESIHEVIHPTEYEPGEVSNDVTLEKGATPKTVMTPPTPTAFDMQPTGSVLEVEATLGEDAQVIELRLAPQIVEHVGNTKWLTVKDEIGNENHILMADFYTLGISTGMVMRDGDYAFMGTLTPHGEGRKPDYSRKLMVFVKADVVQIGKSK